MRTVFVWLLLITMAANIAAPPDRKGKDFALFFTVNNYEFWTPLKQPAQEAEEIAHILREDYGFAIEIVPNATKKQILTKLEEYAGKAALKAPDAQLLIYFSGHGYMRKGTLQRGYFVPKEGKKEDVTGSSYLAYSELRDLINAIPCSHVLVMLDACYSGTFGQVRTFKSGSFFERPGEEAYLQEQTIHRIIRTALSSKSRLYMTSGGENMTPSPSVFARQFKLALLRTPDVLDYDELWHSYIKKAPYNPQQGDFGDHENGRFVFVRKKKEEVPSPNNAQLYAIAMKDGDVAFAQKKWEEAKREYTIALQYKPGDTTALGKIKICDKELLKSVEEAKLSTPPTSKQPIDNQLSSQPAKDLPRSYIETVNGVSFKMIYVEGGSFLMGDIFGEGESDEKPVHEVSVDSYYIGETEVTQALWKAVMGENPSFFQNCDECPVEQVGWEDAQRFIAKLNQLTGRRYRLPTEAEWEYAARERGRAVRFGNGQDILRSSQANFDARAEYNKQSYSVAGKHIGKTTPVKSFKPNSLGLYDMAGNVWEWCSDWYDKAYYQNSPSRNPPGPDSGTYRVMRGGSWLNEAELVRVASRVSAHPKYKGGYNEGLRLAISF
ncbi:MAG: SUMF1/EgtB/PvdO family nonheme iron enzyme [Cytophagales bacterium]|nr:SUMF1/EgtB/PvdO family nonheme iron enzyme [Cytophagales bacterium]